MAPNFAGALSLVGAALALDDVGVMAFCVLWEIMHIIGALSLSNEFVNVADSIGATGSMLDMFVMAASAVTADKIGTHEW